MTNDLETQWQKIKNGDQMAFKSLFYDFINPLCRYAYHFTHDTFLAEEIVQDTFLNLWQKRHVITIEGSLKSYLFKMVHNACVNTMAHQKTHKILPTQLCSDERWHALEETLVIDYFLTDEQEQEKKYMILENAISKLPAQCQLIFSLNRYEHVTTSEIASRLNISVNTVKTQICRALDKIKTALEDSKNN